MYMLHLIQSVLKRCSVGSWVLVGLLLEHPGLTWDVNSSEGYGRLHGVHVAQHGKEHCRQNCRDSFQHICILQPTPKEPMMSQAILAVV